MRPTGASSSLASFPALFPALFVALFPAFFLALVFALVLPLATSLPAAAAQPSRLPSFSASQDEEKRPVRNAVSSLPGLEGAVDPSDYRLAPGDRLAFSIWGAIDEIVEVTVTADGALLIPSVGRLEVAGKTLAEATELARKASARAYQKTEIALSLVQPALLRIPITGQVTEPGSFEILATLRLADAIALAGGLREGADSRAIVIANGAGEARAGEARAFDLLAWLTDGDDRENPRLREGDRVHVPAARHTILVRGVSSEEDRAPQAGLLLDRPFASKTAGVPYRDGDRLDFVLRAAGWPGARFCAGGVWMDAPDAGRRWVPIDRAAEVEVFPGTQVEIPFCRDWIGVSGAVQRPGFYPFLPGQTAADYVGMAGGPSTVGRGSGWKRIDEQGRERALALADTVQAGTRIWVPERRSNKFSALLAPLGTAVAVVVSLIAISTK